MINIAMSADATCRGLISATEGPLNLQLTPGKHYKKNLKNVQAIDILRSSIEQSAISCDMVKLKLDIGRSFRELSKKKLLPLGAGKDF